MELRQRALDLLQCADPAAKATAVRALHAAPPPLVAGAALQPGGSLPGRPARPTLVDPSALPRRSPFTTAGRAALLHAIAHIEFNAIKMVLTVDILFRARLALLSCSTLERGQLSFSKSSRPTSFNVERTPQLRRLVPLS